RSPRRRPARRSSRSTPTATATAGSRPRRPSSTASSTTSGPRQRMSWAAPAPTRTRSKRERDKETELMETPNLLTGAAMSGGDLASRMPQSRYILPSFEERTAYGFKRQDPYAKLFEDRIIFLGVQVDDASADDIMAQLLVLES